MGGVVGCERRERRLQQSVPLRSPLWCLGRWAACTPIGWCCCKEFSSSPRRTAWALAPPHQWRFHRPRRWRSRAPFCSPVPHTPFPSILLVIFVHAAGQVPTFHSSILHCFSTPHTSPCHRHHARSHLKRALETIDQPCRFSEQRSRFMYTISYLYAITLEPIVVFSALIRQTAWQSVNHTMGSRKLSSPFRRRDQ